MPTDSSKRGFPVPHETIDVLDHGYVRYVEHWGSDERVIESARMSTGKGFLGWEPGPCPACWGGESPNPISCSTCLGKGKIPGDKVLLRRLHKKRHTTPFEMAGLVLEIQAPIMVFREWHRHRTQSYNEASARYAPLSDVNYMPTAERCLRGSETNRQASSLAGAPVLTLDAALAWMASLADCYEHCERCYQEGLAAGVPKELARLCVPVGRYSKMRAQALLLNWLRFLSLRLPDDAQEEIRLYARAVRDMLTSLFPRTLGLFEETFAAQQRADA